MKRWGKRLLIGLGTLAIAASAYGAWKFGHPAPPPAAEYLTSTAPAAGRLSVRFFGTTTLLFDDGHNAVMVDSLLTRPGMREVLSGKIASDPKLVGQMLTQARVSAVDLLIVTHSHYDHTLDEGEVARRTGALVAGSPSTREIALGGGIPEAHIRVVRTGNRLDAGAFHVTVFHSRHSPDDRIPGVITTPVHQPANAQEFKEGGTFAYLIERDGLRVIVHASANYVPGMYRGVKADAVFFAVGGLGKQSNEFVRAYWHEVVETTGAHLVVPIHWDDFLRPLDEPQLPLRRFMDDFPAAMGEIAPLARRDGVRIRYMPVIAPVDLEGAISTVRQDSQSDGDNVLTLSERIRI